MGEGESAAAGAMKHSKGVMDLSKFLRSDDEEDEKGEVGTEAKAPVMQGEPLH